MRNAITKRNTPQTHLKPRYTKDSTVRACAEHAHAYACAGKQTLARFARSGAPDSLRCPSFPRSLRSLGCPPFPPMPLRTVPHRLRRQGCGGRSRADNAALMRPPTPCSLQPCSTLSGCRPAGGKPPARLRVLSVLARFARSQAPMRLVLRAAVRLRLSVGLLPTASKSLAFRALLGRASLPQCSNMFLPSPPPCGGRALRGGPRPAHGLSALARHKACARSCGLRPLPSLRSGDSGAMRPRPSLRYGRKFATRRRGSSDSIGVPRCGCPSSR